MTATCDSLTWPDVTHGGSRQQAGDSGM